MRTRIFLGAALTASLLFLAPAGVADSYMKQLRHTDPLTVMGQTQPGRDETIETWLGERAVRIDNADGISVLVQYGDRRMYLINHAERSYAEMPTDIAQAMTEAMAADEEADAETAAAMAAMRGMMAGMLQVEVRVTDTGEQRRIGPWQSRKYLLTTRMGMGTSTSEIWASEDLQADLGGYWQAANATMAGQPGFAEMLQELAKIRGVAVLTVSRAQVMGAEVKTTEELLEFVDKPAPAGTFEIPSGYRQVEMIGGQ